jgi:PEP-CTERM motif
MSTSFQLKPLALATVLGFCLSASAWAQDAAPPAAPAAPSGTATVLLDTTSNLVIKWDLDAGFAGTLAPTLTNWAASLSFDQGANTAAVTSNHVIAPHGEPAYAPPEFVYGGLIATRLVTPAGVLELPLSSSASFTHVAHTDYFTYFALSTNQGYLIAQHVPEPQAYALALAGVGVAGLLMRRRRA